MRTVNGFEALEIADRYGITLYDLRYKTEVSPEQARQFIGSQRDPQSFVINNWPDSEHEAEQIVLDAFRVALSEKRRANGSITDTLGLGTLHLQAAEMAADRLVEQNKLERVAEGREGDVYGLPQKIYLTALFVKHIRKLVCEDCSHADLEGPFHESCLRALFDFIRTENFTFNDIIEEREAPSTHGKTSRYAVRKINIQKLKQSVSDVKSKWQAALQPLLHVPDKKPEAPEETIYRRKEVVLESEAYDSDNHAMALGRLEGSGSNTPSTPSEAGAVVAGGDLAGRPRISKDDVIRYLQHIEIIDESGEVGQLREERVRLLNEIDARERTMAKVEQKRAFLEKQCQDIQRDMDTLLEAMQIAKRRGHVSSQIVEAALVEGEK